MNENSKPKLLKLALYLLSVVVMILIMIHFYKLMPESPYELLVESIVISVVTLVFLYLISGKKTFQTMFRQTGYVVKTLFPNLIFPLLFFFMGLFTLFDDKPALEDGWVMKLVLFFVCMMLVGIYEEACYRCCACDALLPLFKKTRHPFLWTSLISGLIFGYVHVSGADFSDPQQVLQFALKIANLALTSATFMFVYWKTRNLFGMALEHGLNDFLPSFLDEIFAFKGMDDSASYTTGDTGTTIVYLVQLAFQLAVFIGVYRKVWKTIDKEKTLEEW